MLAINGKETALNQAHRDNNTNRTAPISKARKSYRYIYWRRCTVVMITHKQCNITVLNPLLGLGWPILQSRGRTVSVLYNLIQQNSLYLTHSKKRNESSAKRPMYSLVHTRKAGEMSW